jgi:hypothetical protein
VGVLAPQTRHFQRGKRLKWKLLFNLKGLNLWLLGAGIGLNLIWTFVTLIVAFSFLSATPAAVASIQVGMMLSVLAGTFSTGWLMGRMADDNRGPTYGLVGSLGSLVLIILVVLPTGVLGLLLAAMAIAGGFNGGMYSIRRHKN